MALCRSIASISCGAALALASACASVGAPCLGNTCGARSECVANVCSPAGSDSVPKASERIALEPVGFAVIGESQERSSAVARLGSETGGSSALYVAFGDAWKSDREIVRAFLLLSLLSGDGEATPEGPDVPLEAWTVAAPWPRGVGAVRGPRLTAPSARALARPGTRVRIDVTELLRRFRSGRDEGIAVVAASNHGAGVAIVTAGPLPPPLLEVYVARGSGRNGKRAW